jgi:ParB-like chromosome segregation protein Spo0J
MSAETRAKERLSIRRYGFVQPLIVREVGYQDFQIIDGQHRWEIGQEEGLTEFPCWNLGLVEDDVARELTPILNELHGEPNPDALGALLKDLLQRRDEQELRAVMPFSRERFDDLIGERTVNWDALDQKRDQMAAASGGSGERWVERVYRLPADAAEVVDDAVARAKSEASAEHDWQGLELIAADFLGR